jgi:hypothetical protein
VRKRFLILGAIIIALAVPSTRAEATTPPAVTPTPIDSCGPIDSNASSSFVLTTDLTCNLLSQVFPPRHVSIDLAHHTLTGTGTLQPPGDPGSVDVRDGTLVHTGFDENGGTLQDLRIVDSVIGVDRSGTLTRSTVENTTTIIWGSGARITHNRIKGGNGIGIDDVFRGISNYEISSNDISRSTGSGIGYGFSFVFGTGGEITGSMVANHIHDNTGGGIRLGGAVQNFGLNTIAFNLIDHNGGDGILVDGPHATDVVSTPNGPIKIGANLLIANQGAGVDAQWVPGVPSQIVDLGGNLSLFNAKRCIGVRCLLDFTSGHHFGF